MATSGTYTFSLDVEELIAQAFDLVGGEITSGTELKRARMSLNLLLLDLNNKGIPLAGLENKTLSLVSAQAEYTLPSDVDDVLSMVLTRDDVDTPVQRVAIQEFHKISDKTTPGMPTQAMITQTLAGTKVTLYQVPDNSTDVLNYWAKTKIQDAGSYANSVELMTKYFPALVFGLAFFIGLKREGFDKDRLANLKNMYDDLLNTASDDDRERVSFKVTPFAYHRRR